MQQFFKSWGIALLVLISAVPAFSQIQVTFPVNRAVFQRGTDGRGSFSVAGSYFQPVNQIQVKLTALTGGSSVDWTPLQATIQQGNFLGTFTAVGGWYRLEVRGMLNGTQVGVAATVEKMGVGEVFMIAGQSNAVGLNPIPPGQVDPEDRVNTINYDNSTAYSLGDPSFPEFVKMQPSSRYSMQGNGSWAWGWLGNQIASRFNIPVLFINTAYGGTQVDAWQKSAQGLPAPNVFLKFAGDPNPFYPPGMPYGNLKVALQYYGSILGVRAVLWMQGETDSYTLNTSTDAYRDALKFVIQQTRNDTGKEITWVVSQTSRAGEVKDGVVIEKTSDDIINAQIQVIQQTSNTFSGPLTDGIQVPRQDGVHIYPQNGGHQQLGGAWNDALNNTFFATSRPQLSDGLVSTTISCAGNSAYTLSMASNEPLEEPRWSNGQQGLATTVGRGMYYGRVRVGKAIRLSQPIFVPVPTVSAQGATEFCQGGNVKLVADLPTDSGVSWSSGSNGREITATTGGNYTVSFRDQAGCTLQASLPVTVNPLPDKPRIAALSDTTFCQISFTGQATNVTLRAPNNARFRWTLNGTTNQVSDQRDFTTASSGRYTLEVFDGKGCKSLVSDPVTVRVNPNPAKPTITTGGKTTFCADESLTLTSTLSDSTNYIWSPNVTARTRSVRVNQGGAYTVRVTNRFGCPSVVSDPVSVRVNPLPERPIISASGLLAFCERQSVTLCTNSTLRTAWVETSDTLTVLASAPCFVARTSGNYRARVTDINECKNFSTPTVVAVKPLPSKPTVSQIGAYTLRAEASVPGDKYTWFVNNTNTLMGARYATQIIKTPQEGLYSTITSITYQNVPGIPGGQLVCDSERSDPLVYIFEDGNQSFVVYPNPSRDGNLTLETKEDWQGAEVTVWTLTGQLVFEDRVAAFDERKFLRLGPQPGTYIVRVRAEGFSVSKRILVVL